jgi:hypothetical protein
MTGYELFCRSFERWFPPDPRLSADDVWRHLRDKERNFWYEEAWLETELAKQRDSIPADG